jgi:hypothetical protein
VCRTVISFPVYGAPLCIKSPAAYSDQLCVMIYFQKVDVDCYSSTKLCGKPDW